MPHTQTTGEITRRFAAIAVAASVAAAVPLGVPREAASKRAQAQSLKARKYEQCIAYSRLADTAFRAGEAARARGDAEGARFWSHEGVEAADLAERCLHEYRGGNYEPRRA